MHWACRLQAHALCDDQNGKIRQHALSFSLEVNTKQAANSHAWNLNVPPELQTAICPASSGIAPTTAETRTSWHAPDAQFPRLWCPGARDVARLNEPDLSRRVPSQLREHFHVTQFDPDMRFIGGLTHSQFGHLDYIAGRTRSRASAPDWIEEGAADPDGRDRQTTAPRWRRAEANHRTILGPLQGLKVRVRGRLVKWDGRSHLVLPFYTEGVFT